MDKLVSKIAALGIPGLVLVTAIGATGLAGGAAITTALAALGPGGILGGIATLGIIAFILCIRVSDPFILFLYFLLIFVLILWK